VGYVGATNLALQILHSLLDHKDRTCPEEKVEFQV
jgi:nitrogenase molybdenum-iron protein beta chain